MHWFWIWKIEAKHFEKILRAWLNSNALSTSRVVQILDSVDRHSRSLQSKSGPVVTPLFCESSSSVGFTDSTLKARSSSCKQIWKGHGERPKKYRTLCTEDLDSMDSMLLWTSQWTSHEAMTLEILQRRLWETVGSILGWHTITCI